VIGGSENPKSSQDNAASSFPTVGVVRDNAFQVSDYPTNRELAGSDAGE
jgi:hypothetical protein